MREQLQNSNWTDAAQPRTTLFENALPASSPSHSTAAQRDLFLAPLPHEVGHATTRASVGVRGRPRPRRATPPPRFPTDRAMRVMYHHHHRRRTEKGIMSTLPPPPPPPQHHPLPSRLILQIFAPSNCSSSSSGDAVTGAAAMTVRNVFCEYLRVRTQEAF